MARPTIYPDSIKLHADRLAAAPKRAAALARSLNEALGRAQTYADPNLAEQGLATKRADLAAQFRAAAATDLATLREEVAASRDYLTATAAGARPVIGNEVVDLVRAQQKWDQARIQLEAGATLEDVVSRSDLQTVLAIEEFSPSWIASRTVKPHDIGRAVAKIAGAEAEDSTQARHISNAVHQRLVALSDPDVGYAMTAARDTTAAADAATVWHTAAQALTTGGNVDLLDVAVTAELAAPSAPAATSQPAPSAHGL